MANFHREMRMEPKLVLIACLGAVAMLSGCQQRWAHDPEFGTAVRQLAAAQYVNPQAPQGNARMSGLDGVAAQSSVERYRESFRAPAKNGINTSMSGGNSHGDSSSSSHNSATQ